MSSLGGSVLDKIYNTKLTNKADALLRNRIVLNTHRNSLRANLAEKIRPFRDFIRRYYADG